MLSTTASRLGRFVGRYITVFVLSWMRRRADRFDIRVIGAEHIRELDGMSYLLVSNHVSPKVSVLGSLGHLRGLRQFNHSLDSFIYNRLILAESGRRLHTVASCDRGWWSPRALIRYLQKNIGQPFSKAQMEAMGFIPVEGNPGCFQRGFLKMVDQVVRKGQPILIFPEGISQENFDPDRELQPGAAHLAHRFGLPVVAAYIEGTSSWKPRSPVTVLFGEPFFPDGLNKNEIKCRITKEIDRLMRRHKENPATNRAIGV